MKDNFIKQFGLPKSGFSEPTPFLKEFGFSTSKDRKQNNRDFASLYKFFINKELFESEGALKPITILVSYGEKLPDGGITLTPNKITRSLNWPIDLVSTDEFFFDTASNKFFYKETEISAFDMLQRMEELHTKPTKMLSGSWIRSKLYFYRIFLTNISNGAYIFLIYILYLISGTITKKSIWLVNSERTRVGENKEVQRESFANEKINIFGYHASAWSVVAYSILHFSAYTVWYFALDRGDLPFFLTIFRNGFLTVTYVIPTLVFFERLIPEALKMAVVYVGEIHMNLSFKKIEI